MSYFYNKPTLSGSSFLGPTFSPSNVPEIASGYWWYAAGTSGIGTTGFRVIEQNGHSSFDLIQTTVASQPTLLSENGMAQFRMRKAATSNPAFLATVGSVQAGWTGATYMAGWFRLPDASGDVTNTDGLIIHYGAAGERRMRLITAAGTPDELSGALSVDGTAITTTRWVQTLAGSLWKWIEYIFDPLFVLGGSLNTDRLKLFANFSTVSTGSSVGGHNTTIFNANTPIVIASLNSTTANADTTDWAICYYGNGIPSLENRKNLANFYNPSGVLLT